MDAKGLFHGGGENYNGFRPERIWPCCLARPWKIAALTKLICSSLNPL